MDCIFCQIIQGKVPAKKVYEDENVLAFLDINPRNPGHTLVVPKKHAETIFDLSDDEMSKLAVVVKTIAKKVMQAMNAQGISISQSNGRAAGQIIAHVHFHIIPRFLNEGPPGLESILPVKRMDENVLEQIAKKITETEVESKKDEEINFEF